ncbi:hypothetical protein ACWDOP_03930 [Nocardia sp. NPDC003693]
METVTASDLRRLLAANDSTASLTLLEGRVGVASGPDPAGLVLIDRAGVIEQLGPDPEERALVEYAALLTAELRLQGG